MRVKSPRFRTLLPLLLALMAAAPPPDPLVPTPPPGYWLDAYPHDFRVICPYSARLCADYDRLNVELEGAAGKKVGVGRIASLNGELIALVRGADAVIFHNARKLKIEEPANRASIYGGLWMLREKVNKATLESAPDEFERIFLDLSAVEGRADELMADINSSVMTDASQAAAVSRLDALNADATRTWEDVKIYSRNIDRLGAPIKSTAEGTMGLPGTRVKHFVNPMQERVAGLRDRLIKIKQAAEAAGPARARGEAAAHEAAKSVGARLAEKGLTRDVFEHKDALEIPSTGARPPPAVSPSFTPLPVPLSIDRYRDPARSDPNQINLTVSPKWLLNSRPPPAVERPTTPLPPRTVRQRLTGASPLYGGGRYDAYPKETARVAALRGKGQTETVGDPGGRAKYNFRQMGNTCALAASAQMYAEAHGIKPTRGAMREIEDTFYERAQASNQFTGSSADPGQRWEGGTWDEYLGNMLDTPVKKHYLAKDEDLFKAVSGGKMVMISANTGLLWNDKRHLSGGHLVVVTGALVAKEDGSLLGYFINDTGTNTAARFISAKQFLPAWRKRGSVFVEPL